MPPMKKRQYPNVSPEVEARIMAKYGGRAPQGIGLGLLGFGVRDNGQAGNIPSGPAPMAQTTFGRVPMAESTSGGIAGQLQQAPAMPVSAPAASSPPVMVAPPPSPATMAALGRRAPAVQQAAQTPLRAMGSQAQPGQVTLPQGGAVSELALGGAYSSMRPGPGRAGILGLAAKSGLRPVLTGSRMDFIRGAPPPTSNVMNATIPPDPRYQRQPTEVNNDLLNAAAMRATGGVSTAAAGSRMTATGQTAQAQADDALARMGRLNQDRSTGSAGLLGALYRERQGNLAAQAGAADAEANRQNALNIARVTAAGVAAGGRRQGGAHPVQGPFQMDATGVLVDASGMPVPEDQRKQYFDQQRTTNMAEALNGVDLSQETAGTGGGLFGFGSKPEMRWGFDRVGGGYKLVDAKELMQGDKGRYSPLTQEERAALAGKAAPAAGQPQASATKPLPKGVTPEQAKAKIKAANPNATPAELSTLFAKYGI